MDDQFRVANDSQAEAEEAHVANDATGQIGAEQREESIGQEIEEQHEAASVGGGGRVLPHPERVEEEGVARYRQEETH